MTDEITWGNTRRILKGGSFYFLESEVKPMTYLEERHTERDLPVDVEFENAVSAMVRLPDGKRAEVDPTDLEG